MGRNQRIFYACQAVAITGRGGEVHAANVVKGLQSVGMSSTFTLDQVFEMGQIEIYENIEEVADIEVTLEKVIDGEKLIYDLASSGACKTDVVASTKARSDVYLAVFDDGLSHATGVPRNVCMNSGMFISSVSYNYSIDGSATESVTLVGNDRFWNEDGAAVLGGESVPYSGWREFENEVGGASGVTFQLDGTDTPVSGVVRRVDVDIAGSTLPALLKRQGGDDSSTEAGISSNAHIQSIAVSTDFGQENIQELGRFGPYHRYATFPVEVTCDFEIIATSGGLINVSGAAPNLSNHELVIKDTAGTVINLGTKNKLSSVSYSGGDTGGGNATVSYSFSNFNVLTVNGGS
tara:strand:+ start:298 stop:1344 length:1047 start_codon:yes stop_codon:yes gene_type:complete